MRPSFTPIRAACAALTALLLLGTALPAAEKLAYPQARTVEQVDTYFGIRVPDPYRWLEDDNSTETAQWVEAENRVTYAYLDKIPFRNQMKERLEKLYNYPKYSAPYRKNEHFLFSKNDGLQNQSVLYIQRGLDGEPEVLIDPNKLSEDGTVRLGTFSLSKDGKFAVVGISRSGSDWQEFGVMDMATRKHLSDKLEWIKFSGAAWKGDGFFYSRMEAPEKGKELSSKNVNQKVFFHKLGTLQSEDALVFEDRANPERFCGVDTTEDERFAVLSVSDPSKGKRGNALFYRDLSKGDKAFLPLIPDIGDDYFNVVDSVGDKFLVGTNRAAPNGKLVLVDPKNPGEKDWKDILPEKPEPIQGMSLVGGKIIVTYSKDVTSRVYVYDLSGKLENEIPLPALGIAGGFRGEKDDSFVFYTFTSFTFPPAIYRYDLASRKSTLFRTPDIPGFQSGAYETKQVFYNSKDGTRIPMFVVHRKGLKLDGKNPTLLYGYGGFNVSMTPYFSPLRLALLDEGFVYASACMRGGGEYGEKWHLAGTKTKKQNVFDDFIAAAEFLFAKKYTNPRMLAIQGGSNGGLLVGAVANQRPELFRVAIPQVGVMDMLRFQKFTIGSNWITDYGSSDVEEEFKALFKYSPLHNVREGLKYPATLITTADHDDRVVPAHSFKYAATLQAKYVGDSPVIIRIQTKSGHGASNTSKAIEETADIYSFIIYNMGITPKHLGAVKGR